MHRVALVGFALLLAVGLAGAAELIFEAEDWSEPKDAWLKDQPTQTRWNLWSTDKDADKKWSGGVVLQSPPVLADRDRPEDGAPPLHTVITGLPAGTYDISMNGTRAIGLSFDGVTWQRSTGGLIAEAVAIQDGRFELWVDDRYVNEPNPGFCYYDFLRFEPVKTFAAREPVTGFAATRVVERLDRGLVAVTGPEGCYLSWRLLPGDPADIGFNIYRIDRTSGNGEPVKVNPAPITATCDLLDRAAPEEGALRYTVRPVVDGREGPDAGAADRVATDYLSLKLDPEVTVQKLGLGDLDGDGRLDYVLKTPRDNIDPYIAYWKPSPDTYKLEAYRHDGELLWRYDLGWAIERGIWYSPYLVYDFDGDGRAEVAVKIGEGDPRDEDGRVTSGPEWVAILDGQTGQERCRAPWPSRDGFGDGQSGYNHAARNQLAVAFLDGKTPCLIVLRGTYTIMKADAWQLVGNTLEPLWQYTSDDGGRRYRGQGAHFTHCADVDGDGRDEIILGSVVLDDTGVPLWNLGLGHPDHCYVGDIDPHRPGLEIYYGIETRRQRNGMCLVDAATGEIIWGWDQPTQHIHSTGMCSDICPLHPGSELYSADSAEHKQLGDPWLWSAQGEILDRSLSWSFGRQSAWWDADLQREVLLGNGLADFGGRPVPGLITGSVVMVADLLGDWREEIICSVPGELRIHTTSIPAMDRRTTLLADPIYRQDVAMCAMGYTQVPMHSTNLEATAPNLNLTVTGGSAAASTVRAMVAAPLDRAIRGTLELSADGGRVEPERVQLDLAPGERMVVEVTVRPDATATDGARLRAAVRGPGVDLVSSKLVATGLLDGGFERASGGRPVGWTWWNREADAGQAESVTEPVHSGRRAVRVTHDGERDWAFSSVERLTVAPGQRLRVAGWARSEGAGSTELAIVALSGGQTVTWSIGGAKDRGAFDWRLFEGEAVVPEGVDTVYVRWVGHGQARLVIDSTTLVVVD